MDIVKRYVVVNRDTGKEMCSYYNQAPATAVAKSRSRWGNPETYVVYEQTFEFASSKAVRECFQGEVVY